MLEMQTQKLQEIEEISRPNLLNIKHILESMSDHNNELTVKELLDSNIDFNVNTPEELLEQVYLNIEFKNPLLALL